jgi:hypothetical protein
MNGKLLVDIRRRIVPLVAEVEVFHPPVSLIAKGERLLNGDGGHDGVALLDDVVAEVAIDLVGVENIGVLERRENGDRTLLALLEGGDGDDGLVVDGDGSRDEGGHGVRGRMRSSAVRVSRGKRGKREEDTKGFK